MENIKISFSSCNPRFFASTRPQFCYIRELGWVKFFHASCQTRVCCAVCTAVHFSIHRRGIWAWGGRSIRFSFDGRGGCISSCRSSLGQLGGWGRGSLRAPSNDRATLRNRAPQGCNDLPSSGRRRQSLLRLCKIISWFFQVPRCFRVPRFRKQLQEVRGKSTDNTTH